MSFLRLIFTSVRRHAVRTMIGPMGIALGIATMLCVVTVLRGAIRMFERILSSDSEIVVFERNVSDLFFSNVPLDAVGSFEALDFVEKVEPTLFGIVSSLDNPVITCFGVRESSSRLSGAEWIAGTPEGFRDDGEAIVLGGRAADFMEAKVGQRVAIGFVFQLHNLIPGLTLEENCFIPAMAAGVKRSVAKARFQELAERTGIAHRAENRIQDLSGGERQRTVLCRALMNEPSIILADEPTGALDEPGREQVFDPYSWSWCRRVEQR